MPATLREVFVEFCAKYPQVPITLGNYRDLIILQGVKDKLFRDAHPEVMPADLAPLLNTLVAEVTKLSWHSIHFKLHRVPSNF